MNTLDLVLILILIIPAAEYFCTRSVFGPFSSITREELDDVLNTVNNKYSNNDLLFCWRGESMEGDWSSIARLPAFPRFYGAKYYFTGGGDRNYPGGPRGNHLIPCEFNELIDAKFNELKWK